MLVELGKPEGLVGGVNEIHSGIRGSGSCQHYYLHQGKTSTYQHSNKPKPVLNRKKRTTFPEILLKSSTCLFTQLSLRIRSWVFCRKLANSNVCKRLTGGVAPSTFRNPKKL